jgi:hypothetical protein
MGLLVLGSGPLLAIIAAASMGLTKDPNPNPIGPGLLAALTFWPSIIMIIVAQSRFLAPERVELISAPTR